MKSLNEKIREKKIKGKKEESEEIEEKEEKEKIKKVNKNEDVLKDKIKINNIKNKINKININSQRGEALYEIFIIFIFVIIMLSVFATMINSFVDNLKAITYKAQATIYCQKYLEEFIISANEDSLNEKIMNIDQDYLVHNYYVTKDNKTIDIFVTDITNLSKKYEKYEKGLVKKIDFSVYYTYKTKKYKIDLSTVITKKDKSREEVENEKLY